MQRVSPEKNPAQAMGKIKIMQAENSLPLPLFTFLMVRPLFAEQAGTTKILQIVLYTLFKSGYPKNFLPNFPTPKNPEYTSNRTNRIDKNVIIVKDFFF